jgi:tRNA threonylcarbamoyladenosine biosynthesis protein TsaB
LVQLKTVFEQIVVLAFDTATPQGSVALSQGEETIAEINREVTTHSEGLLSLIHETLELAGKSIADVSVVVCGQGPGSFTGLRIGMATAKGLCWAAQKPLICVSSLYPLVAAAKEAMPLREEELIVPILDARRQEIFCALYQGEDQVQPEAVLHPEELLGWLPRDRPLILVGDGALRYQGLFFAADGERVRLAPEPCHQIHARFLAQAGYRRYVSKEWNSEAYDLASTVPTYIRPTDARLPQIRQASEGQRASWMKLAPEEPSLAPTLRQRDEGGPLEEEEAARGNEMGCFGELRLDREGRWWHENQPVTHPRLAQALHRWLDQDGQNRFLVRPDAGNVVYVTVEDAPYIVHQLQLEGRGNDIRIYLTLSDGSEEELDYATLAVGAHHALYCRVKGRFGARFSHQAYYQLGELIEEGEAGFALRAAGGLWPIGQRD